QAKITDEQLKFTSVYSDVDGIAEDVNIRVGELFAGAGQIKIVNTEHLKVTTQVPENYLNKVKIGTPVAVILPDLNISVNTS
ncbi:HlyD family efflux transporter periplasmic adaptor subunit, partial [Acinetobacter baumannii]